MYRTALARPEDWGFVRKALGWGLVLFLLSGAVTVPEVWAATFYVNAATGNDSRTPAMAQSSGTPWKTLSKALANVASGDDVQVASGTYDAALGESFPLELQDGVAIQGAGKATTTLSAPAGDPVFENLDTPLSSGTTLSGFTLTHDGTSTTQTLIHLEPTSVAMAPVIDDNAFESRGSDHEYGVVVDTDASATTARTFSGTISNNSFDGFYNGLYLSADLESSVGGSEIFSPTVSGNTFTDNYDAIHVTLDFASAYSIKDAPKIVDNVATNSGDNDVYYGVDYESGNVTSQPLISGNSFTGSADDSIYISYETLGYSMDSVSGIDGATGSPTITNNTILNPLGNGIHLYYSYASSSLIAHVDISGNKITHPGADGIYFEIDEEFSPEPGPNTNLDFTIANNTVTDAVVDGIHFTASSIDEIDSLGNSTSTIAGNVVDNPGSTGIIDEWNYGGYGDGTTISRVISGNTVTNGGEEADGIYAEGSEQSGLSAANLDIHDNVVDLGFSAGIDLDYTYWPQASQVLASCNTVTNNFRGFVVDRSASSYTSSEAPDLGGGGSGSPGLNSFHDNAASDLRADTDDQFAQSNWWGTTNMATIASHIDGTYSGNVDFTNFLSAPPSVTAANDLTASLSGDVITYTASLEGTGQCGCASSTFSAPTPANTTIVPGSVVVSGAIGPSVQGEDPVEVWVGELGAGQMVTVTWMVQVDSGYAGDVSEQASFGCTQLAADVASDDPSTAAAVDPTVVTISAAAPLVEVPTLQTVGLATLIVLLLLAGWFLVEDKRRRLLLMLVLGLSLGALGVRAAVLTPAKAGAVSAAKTANARAHKARSPEDLSRAEKARLARRSLRAATLTRLAVQGKTIRLALSDGTTLSVPKGHLEIHPLRHAKGADRGLSLKEKRALARKRDESRRLENLRPGQALVVKVRYGADGSVRSVHLRPAEDLAVAKAEVTRAQTQHAARVQRTAGQSR